MQVFDKLYEKYGKDINFELLSKTDDKIVYNVDTPKGEIIVMVVLAVSMVRFLKYTSSLGVQNLLFDDDMDVAQVFSAYMEGKNLVSVQQKIEGINSFPRNKMNMYKMGELLGKLHKISAEKKYSDSYMFIKYPNIFTRGILYLRDLLLKKILFNVRYFSLRNFPRGICHRDINQKNIIMRPDGTLALIDFDMHRYQPFVEGLIRFYKRGLVKKEMFYHFIKGYNSVRPLTKIEKDYIENKLAIKLSL